MHLYTTDYEKYQIKANALLSSLHYTGFQPPTQRFHLLIFSLNLKKICKPFHCGNSIRMIKTKLGFLAYQCSRVE